MILSDDRPTARQREIEEMGMSVKRRAKALKGRTALMHGMSEVRMAWFGQYCIDRWTALYGATLHWRGECKRFEQMAGDDYSYRLGKIDPEQSDAIASIFRKNNHSLGTSNSYAEFTYCQAVDDLFGTRPWMAAVPEGPADAELAQNISKHCQWKFNDSDIEQNCKDALRLALNLGTVFMKGRYLRDVEEYETMAMVAHVDGQPMTTAGGGYVTTDAELEEAVGAFTAQETASAEEETPELPGMEVVEAASVQFDGTRITWVEMLITKVNVVYDNVQDSPLDYNDVAFDPKAPDLDLRHTEFMHRFPIGLMDAASLYNLSDEQVEQLRQTIGEDHSNPRTERGESSQVTIEGTQVEDAANPTIYLVEGYLRCDPFGGRSPKRVRAVFSPALSLILEADYLSNVTPGGVLPVFAIRAFKIPGRILGRGYFEINEKANNLIDGNYNAAVYADRLARQGIFGGDPAALADHADDESADIDIEPGKYMKVVTERKLEEAFKFIEIPDNSGRSTDIMQMQLQTSQNRFGISSAAQGELKGVPETNTATGVNQIMSRGAMLVKWPIDQMKRDLEPLISYNVSMVYANLDRTEVFAWGEGRERALITIVPNDVKSLKLNVTMALSQSQDMETVQKTKSVIEALNAYTALPEIDKESQRPLYIQIVRSYGFDNAEDIVREAVTSVEQLMAMLPPEIQAQMQAAMTGTPQAVPSSTPVQSGAVQA